MKSSERWLTVRALFEDSLDRPAGHRRGWLESACGRDPDLLTEVATLLEAHDRAGDFLARPLCRIRLRRLAILTPPNTKSPRSRRRGDWSNEPQQITTKNREGFKGSR